MSTPGAGRRRRHGATLYLGGSIYSRAEPFATAMLVADGTIAWLGPDAAAAGHRGDVDEVVYLAGALLAPAFVDAHVHTTATGMADVGLDLAGARSLADVLAAVRVGAPRASGGPIVGFGWDERAWSHPLRPPRRDELDQAAGGAVVFLDRADAHGSAVSTALLEAYPHIRDRAGYDDSGWLTGPAHHAARAAVYDALPGDLRREVQRSVRAQAAAQGIGSMHEMGGSSLAGARDLVALLDLAAAEPGPQVLGYWADGAHRSSLPDPRIRGRAGDLFADGTMGSHTAALREDYSDLPGARGRCEVTAGAVRDHVLACSGAGLQAGYHVIGDEAIDTVLAGFDEAADTIGEAAVRAGHHRLEHVELVRPEHIGVMARLGLTASVQPRFDEFWGGPEGMYAARLGGRWRLMNPLAAMQAAGVGVALGSDSPVTPLGPWQAVQAAAWHHEPAHRLSVRAAFAAHTRGGWRAAGQLAGGVLAVGETATFAVWQAGELQVQAPDARVSAWSTDPRSGTPGLPDLTPGADPPVCLRTVVAGHVVHDRADILDREGSR